MKDSEYKNGGLKLGVIESTCRSSTKTQKNGGLSSKNGGLCEAIMAINRKAARLETIINELASAGIDFINRKTLTATLAELGWTRCNTGKMRLWIAPGETIISAGVRKPDNIKYLIGQFLNTLLAGVDSITHADLSEAVINKFSDADGIISATIELMQFRKDWYLDKYTHPRTWKRKVKADYGEI
jgi:hypothetical protein